LEDPSSEPVEITGIAACLGSGRSSVLIQAPGEPEFDALVDIYKKSALEFALDSHGAFSYPEQRLTLAPRRVLAFDLDVAKLKWERMSSSSYSGTRLSSAVPAGRYSEYLSFSGHDAVGKFEVKSNTIVLEVQP
jgi:hypothetical protein